MLIKTAQVEYARRCPKVSIIAYHPGTVDTNLSQPFQSRVPEGKLFSPQQAANYLLTAIRDCGPESAPFYLDWKGESISW